MSLCKNPKIPEKEMIIRIPRYRTGPKSTITDAVEKFHLLGGDSSGVSFARKLHASKRDMPGKDSARGKLITLYDSEKWPMPLTILTMPGLKWIFERQLLQKRGKLGSQSRRLGHEYPKAKTYIVAVENDDMIYRGALNYIPRDKDSSLQLLSARSVKTNYIYRYMSANVEDYIVDDSIPFFDVGWIDFTGFITEKRLEAIKYFWKKKCGFHLTITSLAARWNPTIMDKILAAGSLGDMLSEELDAISFKEIEYSDGRTPMHQITLEKRNPSMYYFGYRPHPRDDIKKLFFRKDQYEILRPRTCHSGIQTR